eukprot:TRINITY_DN3339_c1_g1_i2.p1 TRINITY_DN3339_c1_g1~~TRINITY_DN3339_c1_g1_i2.p1  ORF type:complete len:237 (+),score=10.45 TRINITY_DN3339_c1_g1_i2:136-846(+)
MQHVTTPMLQKAECGGSFSSPPRTSTPSRCAVLINRSRDRLAATLGRPFWQKTVMAAILADSVVVMLECLVDAVLDERSDTWVARGEPRLDVVGAWVHLGHVLKHVLEGVAAVLTFGFVLELSSRVFVHGFIGFVRRPVYAVDLLVVTATLLEESLAPYAGQKLEHSLAVVLRIWRTLRIAHGVYVMMITRVDRLEQELASVRGELAELRSQTHSSVRRPAAIDYRGAVLSPLKQR